MEPVTSSRLRRRWDAVRNGLEVLATLLVIAVATFILYRMALSDPAPGPIAARGGAADAAPPVVPLPTELLPLANAAIMGQRDAPVAIIAYSDFQCPYCGVFARDTWPSLQKDYVDTGKVIFAFRHLPLDSIHPKARKIAEAAECARQQGKFWEFHDALFAQQRELAVADMGEQARGLGLDPKAFNECSAGPATERVLGDSRGGEALGINGTPTFFIGRVEDGGRVRVTERLVGAQNFEAFEKALSAALAAKP